MSSLYDIHHVFVSCFALCYQSQNSESRTCEGEQKKIAIREEVQRRRKNFHDRMTSKLPSKSDERKKFFISPENFLL